MSADQAHWDDVYGRRDARAVSWYRAHLDVSFELLREAGLDAGSRVIDVGGGASSLVDDLLEFGTTAITVLDLAAESLRVAQQRLGNRAGQVRWRAENVLDAKFGEAEFDLWHDRAVLHFLTASTDAQRYAQQAALAVRVGGHAVIGGFAPNGPERCSGLVVARRSPEQIASLMAPGFQLISHRHEQHQTPAGALQSFNYALLHRQ